MQPLRPRCELLLLLLLVARTAAPDKMFARAHALDRYLSERPDAGCIVRPGDDLQAAITKAAAAGQHRCALVAGEFVVHRPVELPSGLALLGAGVGATVVRSAIVPPNPSAAAGWPHYSLASQRVGPQPLLALFFSENASGVQLSAMTLDGGLNASQRSFSNTACGEGSGSDAVDPGFAGCRFLQFGLLLQSVSDALVDNIVVVNASRGVYVRGGNGVVLRDSVFAGNGFGSQTGNTVSSCTNLSVTNCSFQDSLGHGLLVENSTGVNLHDLRAINNAWHGLRLANSTGVALVNPGVSSNGKCGIELLNLHSFRLFGGTITHNACTGQGGICIAGTTQDGTFSSLAVVGNGGNIVGSGETKNLSFVDIMCDMVLYKNKAWALKCDGCYINNVSCHANTAQAEAAVQTLILGLDERRPTPMSVISLHGETQECLIKPGDAIQPLIDELVTRAGGGKCLLAAGVHEISAPIVVPSNVELIGEGSDKSVHLSTVLPVIPLWFTCVFVSQFTILLLCSCFQSTVVQNDTKKSHASTGCDAWALCMGARQLCSHHSGQHFA